MTQTKTKTKTKTYKRTARNKKIKTDNYGILIVDDENLWKQLYRNNLFLQYQNKKYHFHEASDGKEALKIIAQYYDEIDVIIIDLVMDKMGGMELVKFLVDKWGLDDLGIFLVTAYGSSKDMEEAQLRGVRGFIDKFQLDFQQLSDSINTYLDLKNKHKAIDNGFYIEVRTQNTKDKQKYVYLRWRNYDQSLETLYLSKVEDVKYVTIPNLKTDLSNLEDQIENQIENQIEDQTEAIS